jgi:dUTP pyrophosphatase
MREKLFSVLNPNDQYSQEDFDKEFNQVDSTLNSFKMNLTLVNDSTNENPEFATNGSSGFDFRANLEQPILIEPFKRAIVPTGLFFNIPENFEIQVRPRSGLSAKHGVTVLNTPGTIDADYRGEIKIILINLGEENFTISHGDRIAQGVFASVLGKNILNLIEVETLETNTERGSGGFGSTGLG